MVKENIIIPKENLAQVEEVREIENKIPSYEEFIKNYSADEKMNDSYDCEFDSYGDVRVDKSYGPGNSESSEKAAKYIGRQTASKVAGSFLGPAALPVGMELKKFSQTLHMAPEILSMVGTLNNTDKEMIENNPEQFLEEFCKKIKKRMNEKKGEFSEWMDELGGDLIKSGAGDVIGEIAGQASGKVGDFLNVVDKGYGQWGNAEDAKAYCNLIIHFEHCGRGVDYDSDCKVCKS